MITNISTGSETILKTPKMKQSVNYIKTAI